MKDVEQKDVTLVFGFLYLRPENERDAMERAVQMVQASLPEFETYLGGPIARAVGDALTIEDLLGLFHYSVSRDGEGRVVTVNRKMETRFDPALEGRLLEAILPYSEGAHLVFADRFGNGWEWKTEGGEEISQRTGHIQVR